MARSHDSSIRGNSGIARKKQQFGSDELSPAKTARSPEPGIMTGMREFKSVISNIRDDQIANLDHAPNQSLAQP